MESAGFAAGVMGRIQCYSTADQPAHALEVWPDIQNRLRRAADCFLFLDFDGTLSPIVEDPLQAALEPKAKALLRRLHCMAGLRIAIISGRSLSDIRSRVGLDLIYAG